MHPYEIQRLLKLRHKDDVLVLKRGSLYHAIRRVEQAGLIEPKGTARHGNRPARTTYSITKSGRAAQADWLKQMISAPQLERSDFMGALSFLVYLTPTEAIAVLAQRVQRLEQLTAGMSAGLAAIRGKIGRINLVESEYALAMRIAELEWVRSLSSDLQARRLTWDLETLLQQLRSSAPKAPRRKAPAA